METFAAHVTQIGDLTYDVRELALTLDSPPAIRFAAGQFVSFKVPKAGVPILVTRPYSIASPPSNASTIDLLFNLVPGGPGSTYLYGLRVGDVVTFRGPAGTFVLHEYPDRDLLFVATGTGIAPIRSMILSRLSSGHARHLTLFWGLRSERDLYYQDDFRELAARHPNFTFATTLSQPAGTWTGPVGRVQALVEEHVESVERLAVYLCGNSGMISGVSQIIRRRGICPIHREQYYRDDVTATAAQ